MTDQFHVSPLLDGIVTGVPMALHYGVRSYPAVKENTNERYIVKHILIPPTQSQVEAFLITGAYKNPDEADDYFRQMAEDVAEEAVLLEYLSHQGGFLPVEGCQVKPLGNNKSGFEVFLLSSFRVSLARFMQRHPISHLEAVNLGLDMCQALTLCRKAGKMYVDLKPSNIFVSSKKRFKIGDLGFVNLNSMQFQSMPARYVSAYTAPELRDELNTINATADTYALGMLLYQIFNNGKLPEDVNSLTPPANGDTEIRAIIMKACAPNPEDRWMSPGQMGHALIAYLQTGSVNHTQIMAPISSVNRQIGKVAENNQPSAVLDDATKAIPTIKELNIAGSHTVLDKTIVIPVEKLPILQEDNAVIAKEQDQSITSLENQESEVTSPVNTISTGANSENQADVMETEPAEEASHIVDVKDNQSAEIPDLFSMLDIGADSHNKVLAEIDLEFPISDEELDNPEDTEEANSSDDSSDVGVEQLGLFSEETNSSDVPDLQTPEIILDQIEDSQPKKSDDTSLDYPVLDVPQAEQSDFINEESEATCQTAFPEIETIQSDDDFSSEENELSTTEKLILSEDNVPMQKEEKQSDVYQAEEQCSSTQSGTVFQKIRNAFFSSKSVSVSENSEVTDEPTQMFVPLKQDESEIFQDSNFNFNVPSEDSAEDTVEEIEDILNENESQSSSDDNVDLSNTFRTEVIPEEDYDDWDEELESIEELETVSDNTLSHIESILSTPAPMPELVNTPSSEKKPEKKKKKKKHRLQNILINILLTIMMLTTAAGAYFFYYGYFLQTVNELHVTGSQMELSVYADTLAEDGLLTAICTAPDGSELSRDIYHGKAIFTDLIPNTKYDIRIEVKGLHKLKGETTTAFTTEDITEIQQFQIQTGVEDGSALVSLVVEGAEPEQWHLQYYSENEVVHNVVFSGQRVTVTGLTIGAEYTFKIEPEDESPVKGITTQTHTASNVVLPQNLKVVSWENDTLVLQWDAPEENIPYWLVSCSSEAAQFDLDTTETRISIPAMTYGTTYTIEVFAANMAQGSQLKLSDNPISISAISAKIHDGKDLLLTWQSDQGDPEDGWNVVYTVDGLGETTLKCPSSAVTVSAVIPNALYDFSICAADGTTVFDGEYSYKTADSGMYVGHAVSGYQIRTTLLPTPSRADWTNANTSVAEFTDPITPGCGMSVVLKVMSPFYLNEEEITMVFVVRDENGKVVPESTATRVTDWSNMWDKEDYHFASMNIGKAPNHSGKYTFTLYMNGKFVNETKFTVA